MSWIVAIAFAATLGGAGAAHADGVRITIGRAPHVPARSFIVQDRGLEVFGERRVTVVPNPNCYDHAGRYVCGGTRPADRHRPRTIIVPQPIYIVPSRSCYAPGYWHTQWLPQSTLYDVWVPGQWSADGSWIEGHYEQRPYVSGYVPQYTWVPERWAC